MLLDSLLLIKQHPKTDGSKGKKVVDYSTNFPRVDIDKQGSKPEKKWLLPTRGRLKLNVDGSYVQAKGQAGAGMISRDSNWDIIFSACRVLYNCTSALEAELAACDEGLKLALCWANEPFDLESDCQNAVTMITTKEADRSALVHQVQSIKESLGERDI
jgi:hypothetical protein